MPLNKITKSKKKATKHDVSDQPRVPAGSSHGGEFTSTRSAGSSTPPKVKVTRKRKTPEEIAREKAEFEAELAAREARTQEFNRRQHEAREASEKALDGPDPIRPITLSGPSTSDASAAMKREYGEWHRNLSDDDKRALGFYVAKPLYNDLLRYGGPYSKEHDLFDTDIARLDNLMRPTTREMTVYRGIAGLLHEDLLPGKTFIDKGFTSTSLSPDIAKEFASLAEKPAIIRMKIPKGTRVTPGTRRDGQFYQAEYIIRRGSSYRVTHRQKVIIDNVETYLIDMEVIP